MTTGIKRPPPAGRLRTTALAAGLRLRGAHFVLVYSAGGMRVLFGSPRKSFIVACSDIVAAANVDETWIAQTGRGSRARLIFSDTLDERICQRIRNVWTPPAGPRRTGPRKQA